MKWIYIASEAAALIALSYRRVPVYAFRLYLLVSIVAGIAWQPSQSVAWWLHWTLIFEPLRLLLTLAAIVEVGYHATIRMFPTERIALGIALACVWTIVFIIMFQMPNTSFGVTQGVKWAVQGGLTFALLAGCAYLWSKPIVMDRWVRWHGIVLAFAMTVLMAAQVSRRYTETMAQWRAVHLGYLATETVCRCAWVAIALMSYQSPASDSSRSRFTDRAIRS